MNEVKFLEWESFIVVIIIFIKVFVNIFFLKKFIIEYGFLKVVRLEFLN